MVKNKLEEITTEEILSQDWFICLGIQEKIKRIREMILPARFCLNYDPSDSMAKMLIEIHYIQLNRYMTLAVDCNLVNWGADD